MPKTGRGIPPVVGLVARGYAVMASVVVLHAAGWMPSRALAIFLVSMTSIAMLFGIGHLLVASKRPLRRTSFDVPTMIMLYVGGAFVMYFVTLMAERGVIGEPGALVLLAACSLALSAVGVGCYLSEIASNVRCTLARPASRSRVRAR